MKLGCLRGCINYYFSKVGVSRRVSCCNVWVKDVPSSPNARYQTSKCWLCRRVVNCTQQKQTPIKLLPRICIALTWLSFLPFFLFRHKIEVFSPFCFVLKPYPISDHNGQFSLVKTCFQLQNGSKSLPFGAVQTWYILGKWVLTSSGAE